MRVAHLMLGLALFTVGGCSGDGVGGGGEVTTATLGDLELVYEVLEDAHVVMVTECPQLISQISLVNPTTGEVDVTCVASADESTGNHPVEPAGDSGAVAGGGDALVTVPAEGSAAMDIFFNCVQTSSFPVDLTCTDASGATWSETVSLDISGG